MNTMIKRTLTAFLATLMAAGVIFSTVSCATVEDPAETTAETTAGSPSGESNADTTVSESETEDRKVYDEMEKENFSGKTFTVCNRDECKEDLEVEELTNDILDDMIYERNAKIVTDFGIKFAYVTQTDYNAVNSELMNQATSNTDDYDLFVGHKFSFSSCVQNNYCLNLNSIEAINLDGEWWDQACYENLTIDNKTYAMTGDIFPTSMRASSGMVFNKVLLGDLQMSVDDLNAMTQAGEWTLDQLLAYTSNVTNDLSGDGEITYDADRYGMVSWMMDVPFSLYYGAAKPFVSIVNGEPEMTYVDSYEPIVNTYEKIAKIIVEQKAYFVTDVNLYETCYEVFADGRALFCDITLSKINSMIVARNMRDEYGILPMPKYDETQEEYLSFVNGAIPFAMVGAAEKDVEFVGTILEAMARYNYDNVSPKMFEIVTKLQTAQDPISAGMVDLIIRNRIFDLAYFFDWEISNLVINGLRANKETIASEIKSATTQANRRVLPKLIEAYEKCD